MAEERPAFHVMPVNKCIDQLGSSLDTGLNSKAIETARAKYGYNELSKKDGKSMLELILD